MYVYTHFLYSNLMMLYYHPVWWRVPHEKNLISSFFLPIFFLSFLFFVYGDTTTKIRGASAATTKKMECSWVVWWCVKMKCLMLYCLFSIFSIFFSSIFILTFLLFTYSSFYLFLSLSLYSPFLDDEKFTTNNAGRKES